MMVLMCVLAFLGSNAYWAGYVYLLKYKFPEYISLQVRNYLFGSGSVIDQKLKAFNMKKRD